MPKQPDDKRKQTNEGRKDKAAVELGHKGGVKGGPARAEALSPEVKERIARLAANKRWGNRA